MFGNGAKGTKKLRRNIMQYGIFHNGLQNQFGCGKE